MRTMAIKITSSKRVVHTWRVAAAGLLIAALGSWAVAGPLDGVQFVDDLEQSLRGKSAATQRTTNAQRPNKQLPKTRRTAPSNIARQTTPQRQAAKQPAKQSKGFFSKFAFKNPFASKPEADTPATAGNLRRQPTQGFKNPVYQARDNSSSRAPSTGRVASRPNSRDAGLQTRSTTPPGRQRGLFALMQKPSQDQPASPPAAQIARQSGRPAPKPNNAAPTWTDRIKTAVAGNKPAKPMFKSEPFKSESGLALISDMNDGDQGDDLNSAPKFQPKLSTAKQRVASNLAPKQQKLPVVTTPPAKQKVVANNTPAPRNVAPQRSAKPQPMPVAIINQHVAPMNRPQPNRVATSRAPVAESVRPASATRPVRRRPVPLDTRATTSARPVQLPRNPVVAMPSAPVPPPQTTPTRVAAQPAVEPSQPSEKAVALLSQANRQSQTAVTEDEYTGVIQTCRHVLAIDTTPSAVKYSTQLASWALNRRGELKADEARETEALLDFEDALRLDPQRWRAIHNRGVIAAQSGRFADAFDDFNRTIEINPKFAKAYSNRGTLYVQAGKLDKAQDDYRRAIANDPDLAVAHKGRGRVFHMLGDFDTALQHLDAAMLLAPGDARIVNSRGDLLTDMGRYRSAAANYQRAIELDEHLATAHRNLAWLQATCPDKDCRNHELALANASRAISLTTEPTDLEFDTLAAAQAAAGDFDAAKASMDRALELANDDDRANYQWRRGLYEKGEPYVTEPAGRIQQASYAD